MQAMWTVAERRPVSPQNPAAAVIPHPMMVNSGIAAVKKRKGRMGNNSGQTLCQNFPVECTTE